MSDRVATEQERHIYEGEPDEDLIEALEPDQLVYAKDRRLPRRQLGTWAEAALWALRLFVLTMTALVGYVFVASLTKPG
jgi:hypothetical protein